VAEAWKNATIVLPSSLLEPLPTPLTLPHKSRHDEIKSQLTTTMIKPLIELTAFERDDFEFDPQATVKGLGIATTRRFMSHRVSLLA
jgi:hypothetical protein